MLILAIFIIAFFFFFGCAFEFCSYYINYKGEEQEEEEEQDVIHINHYERHNPERHDKRDYSENQHLGQSSTNRNTNLTIKTDQKFKKRPEDDEGCTCKKIIVCFFLAILGIVLQPVYLLFYILLGMMECYRRFACWYFYF